jgi:chromosome segregation ATPase
LQAQLDAARLQLEREIPPLREEVGRLRDHVEELVQGRDAALGQAEALGSERDRLAVLLEQTKAAGREAARHEGEASRLARAVEQGRDQLEALARRNEALAAQADASRTELDRLRRDREEELREHRSQLEAVRRDLEDGLAEATAARERAETAAAAPAELETRLAGFEALIRAADKRVEQLEAELKARRDQIAELESAGGPRPLAVDSDREADRHHIEELATELDEARAANGRLRALLDVFGLPDHLGPGTDLPPSARSLRALQLDGPDLPSAVNESTGRRSPDGAGPDTG